MAEIDAQATSPTDADLLIRPASNLVEGRRYVVALRGLKTATGAPIEAARAFRVYRDGLASRDPAVARRRPAMERIFATLGRAGVARPSLYLAWDFTVASGRGIASFGAILYQHYARGVQRPLLLALIQLLWDRAEGAGYAQHMTSSTYPGTPRHTVLLLEAFGDHQVSNLSTEVEARTIGARLRRPALYPGRAGPWRGLHWGLRPVPRLPDDGTALVVMDSGPLRPGPGGDELGTPYPPAANVPPERGVDPHGLGASSAEIRRLVARFLAPGGALVPGCGGRPCTIAGWTGP